MSDRVLVTGGHGFIGRHLVSALRSAGFTVHIHSRTEGDLACGTVALPHVDHVFHLAARTSVADSWTDPLSYYHSNVLGTAAVLEHCRRTSAALTLMSSYVYGTPRALPIGESHPVEAFNPYSHTKILAEEVCSYYSAQFGLRTTIVRAFNVYGPGQAGAFLIPTLIAQAMNPAVSEIAVADTRPRRDFVHVSDVVRLLVRTIEVVPGRVYNAGSGVSTSIPALVDIINARLGTRKRLVSREGPRPAEVLDVVADISRARRELGWEPEVSLDEGLTAMIDALRRPGRLAP